MNENKNIDKQKLLNAILNSSGSKINQNAINRAKAGDISGLTAGLDEQSKQALAAALKDQKKAAEILSSKEAKEIIKKLLKGGK